MKNLILLLLIATYISSAGQTLRMRSNAITVDYAVKGSEIADDRISEKPNYSRRYVALIIGISDYRFNGPRLPSLENPVKDAQHVFEVLTKDYTFNPENIKLLTDPTRQQIIDALENLSSEINSDDNVLIFYAGHGYYDKNKSLGYWLPADATVSSRAGWIANSTIKDYLGAIKSKHTLLITDACFAGSIFKTRSVDAQTIIRIHELYKNPSRRAMTSGNLSEVPDKSVFIQQFLKKLSENEEEFLPAQKLFARLYESVSNNSLSHPQFGVIQDTGDEGGDFIFIRKKE